MKHSQSYLIGYTALHNALHYSETSTLHYFQ